MVKRVILAQAANQRQLGSSTAVPASQVLARRFKELVTYNDKPPATWEQAPEKFDHIRGVVDALSRADSCVDGSGAGEAAKWFIATAPGLIREAVAESPQRFLEVAVSMSLIAGALAKLLEKMHASGSSNK